MRHVTLTLPTMHIILEISSHGSGEGWRTLEIFRLGCAVVVVQVNFAILCWAEPQIATHPRVAILQKLPGLTLSLLLFFSCV